jgi:hypothetical protein
MLRPSGSGSSWWIRAESLSVSAPITPIVVIGSTAAVNFDAVLRFVSDSFPMQPVARLTAAISGTGRMVISLCKRQAVAEIASGIS